MPKRQPKQSHRSPTGSSGELRIIGGQWRSRKLRFPDAGGVRPTPARTRETLFNWLSFHVEQSRCLDLFAGSGALGLEALSRGAAEVVLVDHTSALARTLKNNLDLLGSSAGQVMCEGAETFLATPAAKAFDIVFMDPPFRQGWLPRLIPLLARGHWVRSGGWVYAEQEREAPEPEVPAHWQLHRHKTAGQVSYRLYRIGTPADQAAGETGDQLQADT